MLVVSMPFHAPTADLLPRAVRSVLSQTHRDLRLVVVNDGGGPKAWRPLSRFRDPRLVRFTLEDSRGRYYADAVTLAASEAEWWTPHDSDDWSDRTRYAALLERGAHADVVLGGWQTHFPSGKVVTKRPVIAPDGLRLAYQANHVGLWRTEALRSIGGPHPDWRFAYDTLQVGLATRFLRVVLSPDNGYHHQVRPGSLSQSAETGIGSRERAKAHAVRQRMWMQSRSMKPPALRAFLAPRPETAERLAADVERLRALL